MTANSPEGQQPPAETIADFFRRKVQGLLDYNVEFVLTKSWSERENLEVLHTLDPNPPAGEELQYHYTYSSFDSIDHRTTRGIVIGRPKLLEKDPIGRETPWRGVSRHYFNYDSGRDRDIVVREDLLEVGGIKRLEFLRGRLLRPEQISDPYEGRLMEDLLNDLFNLQRSEKLKPQTNVFRPRH